jgi:drug/metabolite transporter (DMT)-like permease
MQQKLAKSPFVNVVLFSLFWTLQIITSKLGFNQGAEIIPFTVQSTIVAIITLFIYMLPGKLRELKKISKNVFAILILISIIHYAIGGVLSNAGIALTTAINAGFLFQFATVTTSILAWTILKEKITFTRVLMVVLVMIGSFLLIANGQLLVLHIIGDLLILFACLAWSTANVLTRKVLKDSNVSGDVVAFLRPIAGLPVFLIFILFSPLYPSPVKEIFQGNLWNIKAGVYVLLSGLFVVPTWIYLNRTLKIATASYMTIMSSMTPVLVALLSILILGESLSPIQSLGALIIIVSSFVTHQARISKS